MSVSGTRTLPRRPPRPFAVSVARGPGGDGPRSCGEIPLPTSISNRFRQAALANGIHGLIATQGGCRAFVDDAASNAGDQPPCRQFNRSTLAFVLAQAEPSIVVLGSNWGNAAEISALTDRLLSAGKTVVLIMPLLNIGFDLPQRWIENQIRAGKAIDEWKVEAGPGLTMSALRNEIARVLDRYRDNPHLGDGRPAVRRLRARSLLPGPERAGQFPRHSAHFQRQCEPVQRRV